MKMEGADCGGVATGSGVWTREEDETLMHAVAKYNGKKWKLVAQEVKTRNHVQCLQRSKCLNPDRGKGRSWTAEEDRVLLEQQHAIGNSWKKISDYLPGRTGENAKTPFISLARFVDGKDHCNTALVALLLLAVPAASSNNGLALTPPMGWRSWNCFHGNVNQTKIEEQVDGLVARNASRGDGLSLLDHGYESIGLDDNWQACGTGINGSFHDANGHPLVNTATFPSMKGMCSYGHSKGVKMGWYLNKWVLFDLLCPLSNRVTNECLFPAASAVSGGS
jgi:alpha-galactosidase